MDSAHDYVAALLSAELTDRLRAATAQDRRSAPLRAARRVRRPRVTPAPVVPLQPRRTEAPASEPVPQRRAS